MTIHVVPKNPKETRCHVTFAVNNNKTGDVMWHRFRRTRRNENLLRTFVKGTDSRLLESELKRRRQKRGGLMIDFVYHEKRLTFEC